MVTDWALSFGYLGAGLVSFGEAFVLPLFPDPFILGAEAVGLNVWVMMWVVFAFNVLGAMAGYFIGKFVGDKVVERFVGEKSMRKGEALFKKYGVWAVIVAGFTFLPFKAAVLLAGIYEMPFGKYMAGVLIGRLPRFVIMAWLGKVAVAAWLG